MYRQSLRQFGFKPKKSLGQHFLIDEAVLERILSAAELSPGDIVVEVGPGLGILTEGLAKQRAKVIAVELDSRLVALLKKRLAAFPDVKIVRADILEVAPRELLQDNLPASELGRGYKVIANLPYYITSPVLSHFLETQPQPSKMVVMVQKEVGEAIAATPGKMRLLSVKAQFYSQPVLFVCTSGKFLSSTEGGLGYFTPGCLLPAAYRGIRCAGFFDIVMRGFGAPRKQLRNSLAHSLGMPPSQVAHYWGRLE